MQMGRGLPRTICHLCLHGPYNEGWNYQENILPKYHALMGIKVFQIVTCYIWDNGKINTIEPQRYVNANGVEVIRIYHDGKQILPGMRWERYSEALGILEEIDPDFLFIHDVQFLDTDRLSKFLKSHPECVAVADNHSDFSNSAKNWLSKNVLHKVIWKHHAKQLAPYVKKFYGVLPARVDFLTQVYHLPKEKCELLVMGADDELVEKAKSDKSRELIRKKYGIDQDDFLVMSGGKINQNRPETLNLMKAVHDSRIPSIKLIVFGVVADELNDQFQTLLKSEKIQFAGWLDSKLTYEYMAAADLIVFPGLHSVMWEQAVGMGVPCIFKRIKGFDHVDLGGNALFIDDTSSDGLKREIESIVSNPAEYQKMKSVAHDQGMKVFSYRDIAKRCIEVEI